VILLLYRDETYHPNFIFREISRGCKKAWENLPQRLHYDSACWKSDLGHMTCLRLAEVYLTYLQTQFYIHRLLAKGDASCSPHLVQTCSSLIELSLEVGGFRSQTIYDVYRNFRSSTVSQVRFSMCHM
jgi:hypothetical protein